ncbi:hypothetical protein BpHYR1_002414 [Brachionus plicatilis]|uniref:Uncharacterized protein n=1 Tax=Brachionus plicatilis TaxID=10195 RepID=A0A3M7PSA6_BRAPC|nr:hypothetical protein BpHYR1_002414 [Brachionus plicatilis]
MGKPKPNALRELVIEHFKNGKSNQEITEILAFKVSERTVSRWTKEFRDFGKIQHNVSPGRPITASNHINRNRVKRFVKTYSQRLISRKLSISLGTVSGIIKHRVGRPVRGNRFLTG